MKEIPCPFCREPALGPPTKEAPRGLVQTMGRFSGGRNPVTVKCWRCRRAFRVTPVQFNGWPEVDAIRDGD